MQPDQLGQLLKFLTDTLAQGKDFTVEQAPQFVKELLFWRFWDASLTMGLWIVFALAIATLGVAFIAKLMVTAGESEENITAMRYGIRCLAFVVCILSIGANIYTIVQVKVAPRVVIVEMVRDLLSKH